MVQSLRERRKQYEEKHGRSKGPLASNLTSKTFVVGRDTKAVRTLDDPPKKRW